MSPVSSRYLDRDGWRGVASVRHVAPACVCFFWDGGKGTEVIASFDRSLSYPYIYDASGHSLFASFFSQKHALDMKIN